MQWFCYCKNCGGLKREYLNGYCSDECSNAQEIFPDDTKPTLYIKDLRAALLQMLRCHRRNRAVRIAVKLGGERGSVYWHRIWDWYRTLTGRPPISL